MWDVFPNACDAKCMCFQRSLAHQVTFTDSLVFAVYTLHSTIVESCLFWAFNKQLHIEDQFCKQNSCSSYLII